MLRCPRCGWERRADVVPSLHGLRCVNCGRFVGLVDLDGRDNRTAGIEPTERPAP